MRILMQTIAMSTRHRSMTKVKQITVDGLCITVRVGTSDEQSVKEVLQENGYERKYFKVEAGEHWLDAGCNIGAFSLLCHLRGATSVGYEAEINNAQFAQYNLAANGCEGNGVIHGAVVTDDYKSDTIVLWLHTTDYGQWRHTIHRRSDKQIPVAVSALRISDLLPQFDCLKLDIEGAEIEMLETIENWQGIKKLVFEYHFDTDSLVARYDAIVQKLSGQFDNIRAPKIKAGIEHYTFYPPAKVVFCWND